MRTDSLNHLPQYREEPCKSALNRVQGMDMFGWTLNPYMGCVHRCTYCYVRNYERRADRPWDDRYGASIRIKTNVVGVLRRELARRSWKRDTVLIGAATDPYQPAEGTYRLTRGCFEALAAARTPVNLITRGPLVVRDRDVLQHSAQRADLHITVSIPTVDHEIWQKTEPGTAPPRQRFRAVRLLTDAGIKVGVAMAPLLPGLSDSPERVEAVVRAARDAGAAYIWGHLVHLAPGTREHFLRCLSRDWPELVPRYEALYRPGGKFAPKAAGEPVRQLVAELRERYQIADRREVRLAPPPEPTQLALFALAPVEFTAYATTGGDRGVRYPAELA